MDKKKKKPEIKDNIVAPGMDPDDSYGENATKAEIEKGESTTVTRLSYDEYDPSEK